MLTILADLPQELAELCPQHTKAPPNFHCRFPNTSTKLQTHTHVFPRTTENRTRYPAAHVKTTAATMTTTMTTLEQRAAPRPYRRALLNLTESHDRLVNGRPRRLKTEPESKTARIPGAADAARRLSGPLSCASLDEIFETSRRGVEI